MTRRLPFITNRIGQRLPYGLALGGWRAKSNTHGTESVTMARRYARGIAPRIKRLGVAGVAVLLLSMLASARPAGAASLVVQATPTPGGATYSQLSGVSCTSSAACTAAGYYTYAVCHGKFGCTDVNAPLAERWNGTSWTIQTTPSPGGATGAVFTAVSCSSATACVAVGYYSTTGSNALPLAESWNGSSWTIQTMPTPSGVTFTLVKGVSCASATACIAVGFYSTSSASFALGELWNGTSWTLQSVSTTAGVQLNAVSCFSASACMAVGNVYGSPLAFSWNGSVWTQTFPIFPPSNAQSNSTYLTGVSCSSATVCMAVGFYFPVPGSSSLNELTLAESWNGSFWTLQPSPSVGRTYGLFNGISCASGKACWAVGGFDTFIGTPSTLGDEWNGSSWSYASTLSPSTTYNVFNGVSCQSNGTCTFVGDEKNSSGTYVPLAEQFTP